MTLKLFPINTPALVKRLLIGGFIGLLVIVIFLSGTGTGDPAWGKYWTIRPLIIVPLAGAGGGAFSYLVSEQNFKNDWVKFAAFVLSLFVFLVALWLGMVLGLDGTYWH